ncbi:MAG: HNH endonuclease [Candidatus Polarisedimenticolia bacterium]|nr:HNH endonuclease [bacterium]
MEKTCTRCGAVHPLDEFPRDARSRDGRKPYCRACNRRYAAKRRAERPDAERGRRRRWYSEHKDAWAGYAETYRRAHPERVKAADAARRANAKAARYGRPGLVSAEDVAAVLTLAGGRCCRCGATGALEIDHVVDLARGGSANFPWSLQALCRSCNGARRNVDCRDEAFRVRLFAATRRKAA